MGTGSGGGLGIGGVVARTRPSSTGPTVTFSLARRSRLRSARAKSVRLAPARAAVTRSRLKRRRTLHASATRHGSGVLDAIAPGNLSSSAALQGAASSGRPERGQRMRTVRVGVLRKSRAASRVPIAPASSSSCLSSTRTPASRVWLRRTGVTAGERLGSGPAKADAFAMVDFALRHATDFISIVAELRYGGPRKSRRQI